MKGERGRALQRFSTLPWPEVPEAWKAVLPSECGGKGVDALPAALREALEGAHERGALCPPLQHVWAALEGVAPGGVRVVLLGQDPYHGARQAHGLAFSVGDARVPRPPSLRNVFRERADDLALDPFVEDRSNDLSDWAAQGVLMLNAVLTTELGRAGAHAGKGWGEVTRRVLAHTLAVQPRLVWLLWGKPAQTLHARLVPEGTRTEDVVLATSHPSPLSAYRGFLGSRPFSQTNDALVRWGRPPIRW